MGPLNKLRVLDFSKLLPGPLGTMMLADLGAEVVKVEWPAKIDMVRQIPPFDKKVSSAQSHLNRSKKSITLDLKHPKARDVVYELVKDFDIVVEQFRPGVMEHLGLSYEVLSKINPKLIYCSITGYGQTGPYRDRAGHDINYLALSGLSSYSGNKTTGPGLSGTQVADIAGGSHQAVIGILAAVIARQESGEGQHIDVSIADGALALNGLVGAGHSVCGKNEGPETHPLNGGTFYDYYQCADERYLAIGALEPKFVQQLIAGLQAPQLVPLAMDQSPQSQVKFKAGIAEIVKGQDMAHWVKVFSQLDACVEPVLNRDEVVEHPQFKERQMYVEVPREDGSMQMQIANPLKFSKSSVEYKHTGRSELGADNEEILGPLGFASDTMCGDKKAVVGIREKAVKREAASDMTSA